MQSVGLPFRSFVFDPSGYILRLAVSFLRCDICDVILKTKSAMIIFNSKINGEDGR